MVAAGALLAGWFLRGWRWQWWWQCSLAVVLIVVLMLGLGLAAGGCRAAGWR